MLETRSSYIKILSGIFIIVLVVLALLDKNEIDYIYLSFIFILILRNIIERFKK